MSEDHSVTEHTDTMHSTQNSTPSPTAAGRNPAVAGLGNLNWKDNFVRYVQVPGWISNCLHVRKASLPCFVVPFHFEV